MDFIKERNKIETKLLQGDCLELMKDVEDKSVDLILADLPYSNKTTHNDWDKLIPLEPLWSEYKRVIKLTNTNYRNKKPRTLDKMEKSYGNDKKMGYAK